MELRRNRAAARCMVKAYAEWQAEQLARCLGRSLQKGLGEMTPDQNHQLRVVDKPELQEVYANKVIGVAFDGGALIVTLGVGRFSGSTQVGVVENREPTAVHVVSRIALSPPAAVELANNLRGMLGTIVSVQAAVSAPVGRAN
jgi:hypothetical protein